MAGVEAITVALTKITSFQAYLDDVIVHAETVEAHLRHLEEVLHVHLAAGLKLQPHKTALMRAEAVYLGHVINEKGVQPDPKKIEVIVNWPKCEDITNLQAFLGLCNYYRTFVDKYSEVALPLLRYLEGSPKKKAPIEFDQAAEEAFAKLKLCLTQAPILSYPNFQEGSQDFILDTDWSQ